MATEFKIELEQMHPGVVDMDAIYHFNCVWNGKFYKDTEDPIYLLYCDDKDIKINGPDVIIPYFVRKEGRSVTIRAELNDYCGTEEAEDTYTFDFSNFFSDEPTFFDDFETYDLTKWNEGWEYGIPGGRVEDSDLVLEFDTVSENPKGGAIVCTCNSFKQAFGCFSARLKFPEYTNWHNTGNAAFWLASNVFEPDTIMFKRDPNASSQNKSREHAGEIDICEYSGAFGNRFPATIHWHGWGGNHRQSGACVESFTDLREGYHIFSLVWVQDALYWYVDGKLTRAYDGEGIKDAGIEPGAEMVVLFQICNHWGKKSWVGKAPERPIPEDNYQFRVDWVKVHALKK